MRHLPTIEAGHWLRLDPQYVTSRAFPARLHVPKRVKFAGSLCFRAAICSLQNSCRPCGKSCQSDSIAACAALESDMTAFLDSHVRNFCCCQRRSTIMSSPTIPFGSSTPSSTGAISRRPGSSASRRRAATLLHGGFARRVLTSRRLRSCYSSEYRTPELVHPVEGLDGNCNFSRTTGIVA
jgi:hypothetical protein